MGFHEMPFTLRTLLAVLLAARVVAAADAVAASDLAKPDCQSTCGYLTIPFPFGTKKGCYLEDKTNSFYVTCNDDQLYLGESKYDLPVADISLDGEVKVFSSISRACFNEFGKVLAGESNLSISFRHPKFTMSYTRNKFTVVGCSTWAIIRSNSTLGHRYFTGCYSNCKNIYDARNGSCSGTACCQSPIPEGQREFIAIISNSSKANNSLLKILQCSYAFLVEENAYNFSSLDLKDLQGRERFPMVLDWSVGNETCEEAEKNQSSFACTSLKSDCIPSSNGLGYRCNCSSGYEGNPYLADGCKDIDECKRPKSCFSTATCVNVPGNFTCSCPVGYEGDGIHSCSQKKYIKNKKSKKSANLGIPLGISMSFLGLMVASSLVYWPLEKRKLMKQRENFFKKNGGIMLTEHLSKHGRSIETTKIFNAEDLKKATNNYNKSRIIGRGYGKVFKGVLSHNGKEVAIKKSKICDQSQIVQFINEVIDLSQINHGNVVKLLGCCLETEVPMLVYEFISNGTLFEHIHDKDIGSSALSWEMRLKIAAEIAGAIAYLHSTTSTPIIHGDIKSTNILLDENYTAKVADFGASKLVPRDHTQLATLVQERFGYMDPEYFHSNQLTEKSDVYSFGVLLAELITGEKALSFDRSEKDRTLAMYFVSSVKIGHGMLDIVEKSLAEEGNIEQIKVVGMLAARCLRLKGEERPSMKEVAMELEGLKMTVEHPWVNKDSTTDQKKTEYLLNQSIPLEGYGFVGDGGSSSGYGSTAGFDCMRDQMTKKYNFDDGT